MFEKHFLLLGSIFLGVTKCVTKFLTLSQSGGFDSVKNFVTRFVTPEIWIHIQNMGICVCKMLTIFP